MTRETITCSPIYKQERQVLEDLIPKLGFTSAIRESNKNLHIKVDTHFIGNQEVIVHNLQKGGILIANHEGVEDPRVLLASIPSRFDEEGRVRNDVFGVGDHENLKLYGPNAQEQMIATRTDNQQSRKAFRKLQKFIKHDPPLSDAELMNANRKTADDILEKVQGGGLVILFPQGIQGDGAQWRDGIGGIIRLLGVRKPKNFDELFVTSAYIQGTGAFDAKIYIPGINRVSPLHASVTYLETMLLAQAIEIASNPAHATAYPEGSKKSEMYTIELQKRYEEQVHSLFGY